MIWRIILWLSVIWLVPLMYFFLRNETKFKKNIAVGVTLPYEARTHPEVLVLSARFKKELDWICLALLALAAALMLLPVSFGLMMTIWLVWVDLCVVLPLIPYIRCNRALKALKKARGWSRPTGRQAVADLTMAARLEKKASPVTFVLALAVSALPVWWALGWGETMEGLILLTGPACVLLFWVCWRFAYRREAEVVDENEELTAALTGLRRQGWRKCWVWGGWFMALVNLGLAFGFRWPLMGTVLLVVLSGALMTAMVGLEFQLRKLQEKLTAALLLLMPLAGVWLMREERALAAGAGGGNNLAGGERGRQRRGGL